jgi:NAD(P)-dependent dehydrogenase (short-subunit alcohol dehydrogenase family)
MSHGGRTRTRGSLAMSVQELTGRVASVTGGANGIGSAAARRLREAGARRGGAIVMTSSLSA